MNKTSCIQILPSSTSVHGSVQTLTEDLADDLLSLRTFRVLLDTLIDCVNCELLLVVR